MMVSLELLMIYYQTHNGLISAANLPVPQAGIFSRDPAVVTSAEVHTERLLAPPPSTSTAAAIASGADGPGSGVTPFTKIGPNLPLTILIRSVYVGAQADAGGFHFGPQDLLVTSAVKGMDVYQGAPRAINYMRQNVRKFDLFRQVPAPSDGTFVVFYSPALLEPSTTVTVELAFADNFVPLMTAFSKLASTAAGIPVFAPASAYLMGASELLQLTGTLVDLLRTRPTVSFNEEIVFNVPGSANTLEGFKLLLPDGADPSIAANNDVVAGRLVSKVTGRDYDGPVPYVVLSVDGAPSDSFAKFQTTAAKSDILDRFFGKQDATSLAIAEIGMGLQLYSNFTLRTKADAVAAAYANAKTDAEKQAIADHYAAILANMTDELLKPVKKTLQ
jgi:hypothetical protein